MTQIIPVPFVTKGTATSFWKFYQHPVKFHKHRTSLDTAAELALAWAQNHHAGRHQQCFLLRSSGAMCAEVWGGYMLVDDELRSLWCCEPGQGKHLIKDAIKRGARRLKCYAGPLVGLYSQFGFVQVASEENWVHGEPNVVTMEIPCTT